MRSSTVEFFFVASPKVLSGVCTFVLNLALLHYFAPAEYGIYALCTTLILLSDSILGSSLDLAVLRLAPLQHHQNEPLCLAIQKSGLLLKVALGSLFCLSIAVLAWSMGLLYQPAAARLLFATSAAIISLLLLRSAQVHPQVASRFFLYGFLEFMQLVVKFGGIGLLLAVGRVKPELVLMFFALGPLCGFGLWWALERCEFAKASRLTPQHAKDVWGYAGWFLMTFGLAAVVGRMDIFLLSRWSTLNEVGVFSAGQVIAWVPLLIGTYLSVVLTPRVMPMARDGRFYPFFRKFQSALLAACAVAYLLSLVAIPAIGPRLLPPAFMRSMPVISVLLPGALAGFATFPLALSFVMFVRPRFLFLMDCVTFPIVLLLFSYAIPRYGAVGAAYVTTAANVARAGIAQFMAWEWARKTNVNSSACLALEVGGSL